MRETAQADTYKQHMSPLRLLPSFSRLLSSFAR